MSTWSVQNEAGADDFTDVAPLPTLDFWLWFFAVALGAGELAFAATVGPILTFGAVPVVVCDCATLSMSNPAPTNNPINKTDFFMWFLLICVSRSKNRGSETLAGQDPGTCSRPSRLENAYHGHWTNVSALGTVKSNKSSV